VAEPLLQVTELRMHFPVRGGTVRAVDGVSLSLSAGETLGLGVCRSWAPEPGAERGEGERLHGSRD
jgi:ABC-type microcin C transport system duplicated ATPase subunit YejF